MALCAAAMVGSTHVVLPHSVSAPAVSTKQQRWAANGGGACAKYFSPEFVGAVLGGSAEPAKVTSDSSCLSGMLYITLNSISAEQFRQQMPLIAGTHPISGIGDVAYWNEAGTVSSAKGQGRGCNIGVFIAQQAKLQKEALAQKLGTICNSLFALP
jgi:hypothetical protein